MDRIVPSLARSGGDYTSTSSGFGFKVVVASGGNVSLGSLGGYEQFVANIPRCSFRTGVNSSFDCNSQGFFFVKDSNNDGCEDRTIGNLNGTSKSLGDPSEIMGVERRHGAGIVSSFLSASNFRTSRNPNETSKSGDPSEIIGGGGRHVAGILSSSIRRGIPLPSSQNVPLKTGKGLQIQAKFACSVCQNKFNHKSSSKRCERSHLPWEELQKRRGFHAKCPTCDKILLRKWHYKYHMDSHKFRTLNFLESLKIMKRPQRPKIQEFECSICQKKFRHKVNSKMCEKRHLSWDELENRRGFHAKCSTCDKIFLHRTEYNRHMDAHNGRKPYSCPVCDRAFTQKPALNKHQKIHLVNKKLKKCPKNCFFCDTETDNIQLVNNKFKIKEPSKNSNCYFCFKEFPSADLNRHLATHSKESPFICAETGCRKNFTRNSHLNRHMKLHLAKTIGCFTCAKSFTHKYHLKRHVETVHLKLKPHQCPNCQRTFGQSGVLNRHLITCR